MFGESKAIEAQAPPAIKVENTLNLKRAGDEALNAPSVKTPETKYAANFSRLKKSARKGSRGIF